MAAIRLSRTPGPCPRPGSARSCRRCWQCSVSGSRIDADRGEDPDRSRQPMRRTDCSCSPGARAISLKFSSTSQMRSGAAVRSSRSMSSSRGRGALLGALSGADTARCGRMTARKLMISCLALDRSRTICRLVPSKMSSSQPPQLAAQAAEHREAGVDASVEDLVQQGAASPSPTSSSRNSGRVSTRSEGLRAAARSARSAA